MERLAQGAEKWRKETAAEKQAAILRMELLFQRAQGKRGEAIKTAEAKRANAEIEPDEGRF